jgi:hypothetical protein
MALAALLLKTAVTIESYSRNQRFGIELFTPFD